MKHMLIFTALLLAPLAALHAADAPKTQPERLDSAPYVAGKEGYACYRTPALVISAKGTVLAFCEGRVQNHKDEQGRQIVPGGYVAITEDGKGTIQYSPDDYRRMVRMGANFQVIRTALGRLGGWPGKETDPTGCYQNRFGFEANWPASLSGKAGLPVSERTMGDYFKAAGYVTGMIGKWHLGGSEAMRPYNRGFDETLWHPNGGVLFPDKKTGFLNGLCRGPDPVQVAEYSTDAFGREAAEFIGRHRREPFFLYLCFVPPHWPMEAKPEHLAKFAHIADLHRRTMLAMMASLDENVGRVLAKLRETKLEENTLVFFLSDNGGPTGRARPQPDADFEYGQNTSKNDPCRGVKGDLLEGGIRIPFMVQWKGRIPAGKTYDQPVISLDILPTALAAAGAEPQPDRTLDGTNLLPFLAGEKQGAPHDTLWWRFRFPPNQPTLHRWAIRQGDWKLVKNGKEPLALYNLANDIGESKNLATDQPDRIIKMKEAYQRWDAQNKEPLW